MPHLLYATFKYPMTTTIFTEVWSIISALLYCIITDYHSGLTVKVMVKKKIWDDSDTSQQGDEDDKSLLTHPPKPSSWDYGLGGDE